MLAAHLFAPEHDLPDRVITEYPERQVLAQWGADCEELWHPAVCTWIREASCGHFRVKYRDGDVEESKPASRMTPFPVEGEVGRAHSALPRRQGQPSEPAVRLCC